MILTAQEEYGIRCAVTLARAQREGQDYLTLNQIAEAEGLTNPYAGKVVRLLVQANLVASTRGRLGGYCLARPAGEVSVAETLRALGTKFYDGEICQRPTSEYSLCVHNSDCSLRAFWGGLQRLIDDYLNRTTLGELLGGEAAMRDSLAEVRQAVAAIPTTEDSRS